MWLCADGHLDMTIAQSQARDLRPSEVVLDGIPFPASSAGRPDSSYGGGSHYSQPLAARNSVQYPQVYPPQSASQQQRQIEAMALPIALDPYAQPAASRRRTSDTAPRDMYQSAMPVATVVYDTPAYPSYGQPSAPPTGTTINVDPYNPKAV